MFLPQGNHDTCHVNGFSVALLTEHMTFKVLLSPGWSLCIYSCSSLYVGLQKRDLISLGRGKWNWETDLCVHCMRTTVIKGLSWLLCVGSSLRVLCSFRRPIGKKTYFCMEPWSAVPACCAACEPHAAVSVWSSSVLGCCGDCQEFHGLFLTSEPMLWPLPEEWAWCWFGPYLSCCGLSLTKKPSGSMRADSGKGPCQPLRITLLLSLCTEASPCVKMDNVHNSPQPSESVSLAVTMPHWACP